MVFEIKKQIKRMKRYRLNTCRFFIGRRLWQFYGNGCRFDTIVNVEKIHIELAGEGRITKIDASKRWNA